MTKFLLFFFLCAGFVSAERPQFPKDEEYTISPTNEGLAGRNLVKHGQGIACGKYFFLPGGNPYQKDGKFPLVLFEFKTGDEKDRRYHMMLMGKDKFIVIVDESKSEPSATYIGKQGRNDPVPFHWVIRMSEKDAVETQPCLPPPIPRPTK